MRPEKFTCHREGLKIRGKVYRNSEEPQPAVILSHGFLANSDMCRTYAKVLADAGYAAFTFDFCGGGLRSRSDGRSEDMTILTEVRDLHAVYQYVRSLPYVISERISLLGCSQGGVVSAISAKDLDIEKLILLYPAVCIPDDARAGKMMFYKFDPGNIPDILGRFPMKLGGDYARTAAGMDIYEEISGFAGPVLYIHGTKDEIVDISYAKKAHCCFPDCEYHEIEGAGHGFKGEDDRRACELIREFMK